jgi:hypothetical protein
MSRRGLRPIVAILRGRRGEVMTAVSVAALLLVVAGVAAASLSVPATRLVLQPGDLGGSSTKLLPRLSTRTSAEKGFGVSFAGEGWASGAMAKYSFSGRAVDSEAFVFDTVAGAHRAFVALSKRLGSSGVGVAKVSVGAESRMFTIYFPVIGPEMTRTILWRYQSVIGYVDVGSSRPFPSTAAITIAQTQSRRIAAAAH